MAQRSPEWYAARCGKVTASRFADVLAKGKGSAPSLTREGYLTQLVTERLTGQPADAFGGNWATDYGTAMEEDARIAVEAFLEAEVEQVDFLDHPKVPMVGASPDGLVTLAKPALVYAGAGGAMVQVPPGRYGVEIKCPAKSHVHVATLRNGFPSEHRAQVQGGMWVTELDGWLFASYDPRMPPHLQLFITLVKRDPAFINELATEVRLFLGEIDRVFLDLIRR